MDVASMTDKYFTRTRLILGKEGIDPVVRMAVFARADGVLPDISEATGFIREHAPGCRIWRSDHYHGMRPFLVLQDRIRSIIELETVYLGILSDILSRRHGFRRPTPQDVRTRFAGLRDVYRDLPIIYFGARHYHPGLDPAFGRAALEGGAVQASTDAGSGGRGAGTMPHILPLIMSTIVGEKDATLESAKLFDRHVDPAVPRVTLVDTFGREITDTLSVARHFGSRRNMVRIDTCSESRGEGMHEKGVTLGLVRAVREALDSEGLYSCGIFLSGGFGDLMKAKTFMQGYDTHMERTGKRLFEGVGAGEVSEGVFCTADLCEVDGRRISKAGRTYDIRIEEMKEI